MMNIIVLSDTHLPKKTKKLPTKLRNALQHADLIIHAGDWQTMAVYDELSTFANVEGVAGNVDNAELLDKLGKKKIIKCGRFNIGITHGDGNGKTTEKRAIDTFLNENVDVVIYGHSHIPVLKRVQHQIILNPGSPTDKRKGSQYSFAKLIIDDQLHIELIFFDSCADHHQYS